MFQVNMNDQVAEIQRALDALEMYAEQWIIETMPNVTDIKRLMWYKNADGSSPWMEIMKVRSELLLARAMATGPLAQAAEAATDEGRYHYCEICKGLADHKTAKHPWPSRSQDEVLFQAAYDATDENTTVRELVEAFQEAHGSHLTVEFIKWLTPKLERKRDV